MTGSEYKRTRTKNYVVLIICVNQFITTPSTNNIPSQSAEKLRGSMMSLEAGDGIRFRLDRNLF